MTPKGIRDMLKDYKQKTNAKRLEGMWYKQYTWYSFLFFNYNNSWKAFKTSVFGSKLDVFQLSKINLNQVTPGKPEVPYIRANS